jgi:hypothetical protein
MVEQQLFSRRKRTMVKKKKKKKKPLTMKNFFPTLKNSQGFDLHLCRYEESIQQHVFLPKKYGYLSRHRVPHQFCNECKLKPCIIIEHEEEIFEIQYQEHNAHDIAQKEGKKVRELTAVNRSERRMMNIMTRHFGKDYVKKWGVPNCIIKESHSYYELHKKEREEEEAGYSSCSCDCSCSEGSTDEEDVANDCKEVGESGSGNSGTKKNTIVYEIGCLEYDESSGEENEF